MLGCTVFGLRKGWTEPEREQLLLTQLRESLDLVLTGKVEPVPVSDGNVEFRFEGFSLLMRGDYHSIPAE